METMNSMETVLGGSLAILMFAIFASWLLFMIVPCIQSFLMMLFGNVMALVLGLSFGEPLLVIFSVCYFFVIIFTVVYKFKHRKS